MASVRWGATHGVASSKGGEAVGNFWDILIKLINLLSMILTLFKQIREIVSWLKRKKTRNTARTHRR
jgi:hypothetical protein